MSDEKRADAKPGAIGRIRSLIAPLFGRDGAGAPPSIEAAHETVTKIAALMDERVRLRGLAAAEEERVESLTTQLGKLNAQRIEVLTESRISADADSKTRADALLEDCARVRQEIEDAAGIAASIKARVQVVDRELEPMKVIYRRDLGFFLTAMYAGYMEEYNRAAPEVAELIFKIAATRKVMLRYLAGNSNGWDGTGLLPGMRPGDGRYVAPILDAGAREFENEATARMEAILEKLKDAGFIWRMDLD